MWRVYASYYNQEVESQLKRNSVFNGAYDAWIDSDYTDTEARDEAIKEANSLVVIKLRKKALAEIYMRPHSFAGDDKELAKSIKAQMEEAIQDNIRKKRKRGNR